MRWYRQRQQQHSRLLDRFSKFKLRFSILSSSNCMHPRISILRPFDVFRETRQLSLVVTSNPSQFDEATLAGGWKGGLHYAMQTIAPVRSLCIVRRSVGKQPSSCQWVFLETAVRYIGSRFLSSWRTVEVITSPKLLIISFYDRDARWPSSSTVFRRNRSFSEI